MGGAPSKTRKLTVENDDPSSVIKLSEDVVHRIQGRQCMFNLTLKYTNFYFFST